MLSPEVWAQSLWETLYMVIVSTAVSYVIGRAARNAEGRVILYADKITDSIKNALEETNRRREKQIKYNVEHGITPQTIKKKISNTLEEMTKGDYVEVAKDEKVSEQIKNIDKKLRDLNKAMRDAAANLEFEQAMVYRDEIKKLEQLYMKN